MPPAIRTWPLINALDVWSSRGIDISPVAVNNPVRGSQFSAGQYVVRTVFPAGDQDPAVRHQRCPMIHPGRDHGVGGQRETAGCGIVQFRAVEDRSVGAPGDYHPAIVEQGRGMRMPVTCMEPVAVNMPVFGSYSSAVLVINPFLSEPPLTKTLPSHSKVALPSTRGATMLPLVSAKPMPGE